MSKYFENGIKLLKVLTNNGCEAYIIGEASRCQIMNTECQEVEIITSATPGQVKQIFSDLKFEVVSDNVVQLAYEGNSFLISTFRSLDNSHSRKRVVKNVYSKNLGDELANRDFTINAIAVSPGEKYSDAYNGLKHIKQKLLVGIGNNKQKFSDNPIYVLRLARLHSELGYKIHASLMGPSKIAMKAIAKCKPKEYIKELERLLQGKYHKRALDFLRIVGVKKHLPILGKELERLSKIKKTEDLDRLILNALVLKGEIINEYLDLTTDPAQFKQVLNLAIVAPKGQYDNVLLYNYGLDAAVLANKINNGLAKAKRYTKAITKQYQKLPIKKPCDLEFKGEDLLKLCNEEQATFVTSVMEDVIYKVLTLELPNEYDTLKVYAIRKLQEMKVLPVVEEAVIFDVPKGVTEGKIEKEVVSEEGVEEPYQEEVITPITIAESSSSVSPVQNTVKRVEEDFNEYRYMALKREIEEVRHLISEKDQRINELQKKSLIAKLNHDVDQLVSQNLGMLTDMNYLDKESDKMAYAKDIRKTYQEMLLKSKPEYRVLTKEDLDEKN